MPDPVGNSGWCGALSMFCSRPGACAFVKFTAVLCNTTLPYICVYGEPSVAAVTK